MPKSLILSIKYEVKLVDSVESCHQVAFIYVIIFWRGYFSSVKQHFFFARRTQYVCMNMSAVSPSLSKIITTSTPQESTFQLPSCIDFKQNVGVILTLKPMKCSDDAGIVIRENTNKYRGSVAMHELREKKVLHICITSCLVTCLHSLNNKQQK